jgi:hypothetical protein
MFYSSSLFFQSFAGARRTSRRSERVLVFHASCSKKLHKDPGAQRTATPELLLMRAGDNLSEFFVRKVSSGCSLRGA